MPKRQEPPTSLRVPPDLEEQLAAFMKARKMAKRGTAIVALMRLGLQLHADLPRYVVKEGSAPGSNTAPVHTGSVPLKEGARLAAPRDDRARWDIFRSKTPRGK